jgi:hypothetical protein
MNKMTSVPSARAHSLLCLAAVALLTLQISSGVFARGNTQREGNDVRVRLNKTLTSKDSRAGDKFTATVVDAGPFNGAKIVGHVESIKQSGRFKGATEMYLSFDRIRLRDGENYAIGAEIIRLYDVRSGEEVDAEGGIETSDRGPQTLKRTGIGALAGGIFGAILGGGNGAAIGSIVGGAAGAGTTAASGRKELVLDQGVEMLIRIYRR